MNPGEDTSILVQDDGALRTITLNRPESRNALTPGMQDALIRALRDAGESACRVVLLRGAGAAFCAGLDLSVLRAMAGKSEAEYRTDAVRVATMFRTLYALPKPTIAAVHGPAIAGGTGLATLCDFTLATPDARFGYTEVRIGFVPALVSVFLALQVGEKHRRDLLLTGRLIGADEAFRIGLAQEVVPAADLQTRVQELAGMLMQNSPQSLSATKRLLVQQQSAWLDAAIEDALQANAASRQTGDFQEGIAAFLEKRKPAWTTGPERKNV